MTELPSLAEVRYPPIALGLWRRVDAVEDAAVERFVSGFAALDPAEAARVRAGLGETELVALLAYAQRCALGALHTREIAHVLRAVDALSAVALDAVPDDRDVDLVAMLVAYAGTQLDRGLRPTVAAALDRAEPELAELVAELLRTRIDLVDECGYREVATPAGRVLLEDESARYAPAADLVAATYAVADLLEADRYRVDAIGIGQTLHPIWVGDARNPDAVAAAARLTGCAHLSSELRDTETWQEVSVYLGEASSGLDAATIATAADGLGGRRHPQLAVAAGALFAICYASTPDGDLDGDPNGDPDGDWSAGEDPASLERFRPALTRILAAAAPAAR